MKENYKCSIDLEKLKQSKELMCSLDSCISTKDFTSYFTDIEKEINNTNFEHGNCITNYKDDIDTILEEITKMKENISKLNNALDKTVLSFQNRRELNNNEINNLSETYPNTTATLKLKSIMNNDSNVSINILDIDNDNVQKIPLPTPTVEDTSTSSSINTVPIGIAIGATGIAASAGAVYLTNKNDEKKKINLPTYEGNVEIEKKEENKEDVFEITPYKAERNPENFNKFYADKEIMNKYVDNNDK